MPAQPYVGQIIMFGGNFAPSGWAFCNGQILPISENEVLFNLIGTTYGGDGQSTFALPDLRGRAPVHLGSTHVLGQVAGTESVTLLVSQLPLHSHTASTTGSASDKPATDTDPAGRVFAIPNDGSNAYSATADSSLGGAVSTASDGGNQPHDNMQPYLCVNFCISLFGVYPTIN